MAVPVVTTPRPNAFVQLSTMWALATWSLKIHSSSVGLVEYIGVSAVAAVVVSVTGVDDGTGFGISPSMYPRSPLAASN